MAKLLAILTILAALLSSCGNPPETRQLVTINASDGVGGIIDPVNVSATYAPRGATVARVHGGETVTMLRREGDGVLIETKDGTQGWVTYWFINGLKKE